MMPKICWDYTREFRGVYYPELNIIAISPYMKKSLIFSTLLHEVIHWLIFRLGRSDAVYKLNCAWDMLDFIVTNKKMP